MYDYPLAPQPSSRLPLSIRRPVWTGVLICNLPETVPLTSFSDLLALGTEWTIWAIGIDLLGHQGGTFRPVPSAHLGLGASMANWNNVVARDTP